MLVLLQDGCDLLGLRGSIWTAFSLSKPSLRTYFPGGIRRLLAAASLQISASLQGPPLTLRPSLHEGSIGWLWSRPFTARRPERFAGD